MRTRNEIVRKPIVLPIVILALAVAFLACWGSVFADEWKQAIGLWTWVFPGDHGVHPDFRTEWWYFTGNLRDSSGRCFGYQLTFFRQGITLKPNDPNNPWSVRDLYLAHFALTDGTTNQF